MKNHKLPTEIDLSRTILWQYSKADRLIGLIRLLQESAELSTVGLWKLVSNVLDITTPITEQSDLHYREIGLSIVSRLFDFDTPVFNSLQGYEELEARRRYILGSLFLIDSDGSIQDINQWLHIVFPTTQIFVYDNYDMTISYVYPESISALEKELVDIEGFLPCPAGVRILEVTSRPDYKLAMKWEDKSNNEMVNLGANTMDNARFASELE